MLGDAQATYSNTSEFATLLLNGGTSVGYVASASNSAGYSKATFSSILTELSDFSSAALAAVDLLLLGGAAGATNGESGNLNLSASDIDNIGDFLSAGGNVLLQVEGYNAAASATWVNFLAGVGSDITFGAKGGYSSPTPLGITFVGPHLLNGGTGVVTTSGGGTLVASSEVQANVPLPAAGLLLVGGIGALGLMRRRAA